MCPYTDVCPHTAIYVSSYCGMCPHTAVYVSSYCCICVLMLLYVSSYCCIRVLILLYVSSYSMCALYDLVHSTQRRMGVFKHAQIRSLCFDAESESVPPTLLAFELWAWPGKASSKTLRSTRARSRRLSFGCCRIAAAVKHVSQLVKHVSS